MSYPYLLSVAPMLHLTDKHCRYFYRLLNDDALLYTEMITSNAILNGDKKRLLDFDNREHPVSLQLGGSVPKQMAECARIGEDWGYDSVNINVGCPSDRVQSGAFGACLMKTPNVVADCIDQMRQKTTIPVTVKCRIGVDDIDDYQSFYQFVKILSDAGCQTFIVHARKAWLNGLSPKENRTIPALNYAFVYQLKKELPNLNIVINGGIEQLSQMDEALAKTDGVMLGRVVYKNPYCLAEIAHKYGNKLMPIRAQILSGFMDYMAKQIALGVPIKKMTRHILGLYFGQKGARQFKQLLSANSLSLNDINKWLKQQSF